MKPKFRPRKRKTVKPAPKAEPKRDWMDQDGPRDTIKFPAPSLADDKDWGWPWPMRYRLTSALFTDGMRFKFPHPSEYVR